MFYIVFVLLFWRCSSEKPFKIATMEQDPLAVKLDLEYLNSDPVANQHLFSVSVAGSQGTGKSTLLRSLGALYSLSNADFDTGDSNVATTVSVLMSSPSKDGVFLIDQPGHDDPTLFTDSRADAMLTRLLAPVTNVLIHSFVRTIRQSDLDMLASYCDERLFLGAMQVKATKPSLILAIRGRKLDVVKDGVTTPGTPSEYLDYVLPANHVARRTFGLISVVLIPELSGADFEKLHSTSFHPRDVESYGEAFDIIGTLIWRSRDKSSNLLWTGRELSNALTTIVVDVNSLSSINIPSVRMHQIMNRVEKTCLENVHIMTKEFDAIVEDPFNPNIDVDMTLIDGKRKFSDNVLNTYKELLEEDVLGKQINQKILSVFDAAVASIIKKIETAKENIRSDVQRHYEVAAGTIIKAHSAAMNSLNGNCDSINIFFGAAVDAVDKFDKFLEGGNKDKKQGGMLKVQIRELVNNNIQTLHSANRLAFSNKANELKHSPGRVVKADYVEHRSHCGNGDEWHHFNMADRFKEFSIEQRQFVHHIDCFLDARHSGGGRLVLEGNDQIYWFHQNADTGRKGHGSAAGFNPQTRVITVKLWGWGWGGGNCNNRKWVNAIKCEVTMNALWDDQRYAQDYQCGMMLL